jgi:hypothetical protein
MSSALTQPHSANPAPARTVKTAKTAVPNRSPTLTLTLSKLRVPYLWLLRLVFASRVDPGPFTAPTPADLRAAVGAGIEENLVERATMWAYSAERFSWITADSHTANAAGTVPKEYKLTIQNQRPTPPLLQACRDPNRHKPLSLTRALSVHNLIPI